MHSGLERVSTLDISREEWIRNRQYSIGGSDAAAIVGLNEWSSPYRVWADKTGRLPEIPDNTAMRVGRELEDCVARMWGEDTGKKIRRSNAILRNPTYPFAHANVDRLVVGEDAGLECKTTSALSLKHFKDGNYPDRYYVQCMHYMAVTGLQRWYLAVLVGNKEFYTYTIERSEAEIASLMAQEEAFWRFVQEDTPPPADGSEATTKALQSIYADEHDGQIELFGREALIREYFEQKAFKDTAEKQMEKIKQILMLDLGGTDTGITASFKVTWKPQSRRVFDAKSFAKDHPDMDIGDYYNTTTFRKFDIREV